MSVTKASSTKAEPTPPGPSSSSPHGRGKGPSTGPSKSSPRGPSSSPNTSGKPTSSGPSASGKSTPSAVSTSKKGTPSGPSASGKSTPSATSSSGKGTPSTTSASDTNAPGSGSGPPRWDQSTFKQVEQPAQPVQHTPVSPQQQRAEKDNGPLHAVVQGINDLFTLPSANAQQLVPPSVTTGFGAGQGLAASDPGSEADPFGTKGALDGVGKWIGESLNGIQKAAGEVLGSLNGDSGKSMPSDEEVQTYKYLDEQNALGNKEWSKHQKLKPIDAYNAPVLTGHNTSLPSADPRLSSPLDVSKGGPVDLGPVGSERPELPPIEAGTTGEAPKDTTIGPGMGSETVNAGGEGGNIQPPGTTPPSDPSSPPEMANFTKENVQEMHVKLGELYRRVDELIESDLRFEVLNQPTVFMEMTPEDRAVLNQAWYEERKEITDTVERVNQFLMADPEAAAYMIRHLGTKYDPLDPRTVLSKPEHNDLKAKYQDLTVVNNYYRRLNDELLFVDPRAKRRQFRAVRPFQAISPDLAEQLKGMSEPDVDRMQQKLIDLKRELHRVGKGLDVSSHDRHIDTLFKMLSDEAVLDAMHLMGKNPKAHMSDKFPTLRSFAQELYSVSAISEILFKGEKPFFDPFDPLEPDSNYSPESIE